MRKLIQSDNQPVGRLYVVEFLSGNSVLYGTVKSDADRDLLEKEMVRLFGEEDGRLYMSLIKWKRELRNE
jgi:hypothetical protein